MNMLSSKYFCLLSFAFVLIIAGAFSLLWVRQQVYLQASYGKRLEKTFFLLQQKLQQTDLRLARIQSTQHLARYCQELQSPSRAQTTWANTQSKQHFAHLALNN